MGDAVKHLCVMLLLTFFVACRPTVPSASHHKNGVAFDRYGKCFPDANFWKSISPRFSAAKRTLGACSLGSSDNLTKACKLLSKDTLHLSFGHDLQLTIPNSMLPDTANREEIKEVEFISQSKKTGIQVVGQKLRIPYKGLNGASSRTIAASESLYTIYSPQLCQIAQETAGKTFAPDQTSGAYYAANFGKYGVGKYLAPAFSSEFVQSIFTNSPHVSFVKCNCLQNQRSCNTQDPACSQCISETEACRESLDSAFAIANPHEAALFDFKCSSPCAVLERSDNLLVCATFQPASPSGRSGCELSLRAEPR